MDKGIAHLRVCLVRKRLKPAASSNSGADISTLRCGRSKRRILTTKSPPIHMFYIPCHTLMPCGGSAFTPSSCTTVSTMSFQRAVAAPPTLPTVMPTPASTKVFLLPELLESIIACFLKVAILTRAQRVSPTWKTAVASPKDQAESHWEKTRQWIRRSSLLSVKKGVGIHVNVHTSTTRSTSTATRKVYFSKVILFPASFTDNREVNEVSNCSAGGA